MPRIFAPKLLLGRGLRADILCPEIVKWRGKIASQSVEPCRICEILFALRMVSSSTSQQVVSFGVFELNLKTGELRKAGAKISLQSQPFQILVMLLERPGEVVTREEVCRKLWPADTFVDFEHGLNRAINKLRETLGDSADNPRFIETLPRRGYRLLISANTPVAHAAPETVSAAAAVTSLAVLPLINVGTTPDLEYL